MHCVLIRDYIANIRLSTAERNKMLLVTNINVIEHFHTNINYYIHGRWSRGRGARLIVVHIGHVRSSSQ